jgi:hypothetical protein
MEVGTLMRRDAIRYALVIVALVAAVTLWAGLRPEALGGRAHSLAPAAAQAQAADELALVATVTSTSTGTATSTATPTTTGTPTPTGTITNTPTITGTPTASGTVTLVPTIFLSTPSGPPGSTVTITGGGFTPSSPISITVGGQIVVPTGGLVTANPFGGFGATITIPSSLPIGQTVITASDSRLQQVQVPFTVTTGSTPGATALNSAPNAGPPGAQVVLSVPVGGLPASAAASVVFTDAAAGNPSAQLIGGTVNADGSLSLSVSIPGQATAGAASIQVAANGVVLTTTFTVQPAIVASPPTAQAGATVQVTGNGFAANRTITITVAGQVAATTSSVTTNSLGSFAATVAVPVAVAAALTTITAADGANSASAPFVVTTGVVTPTGTAVTTSGATATPTSGFVPFPTVVLPTLVPPTSTVPPGITPSPAPTRSTSARPLTTAFFAEGYTGQARTNGKASFVENLNVLNPGAGSASVTFTYFVQGSGHQVVINRAVAPHTAMRESVNGDVGPDKLVAVEVTSPQVIGVTRSIDRLTASGSRLDSSTTVPVSAPARTWGFPEGYTGSTFQEYLTLLNPSRTMAQVTVRLAPQASSDDGARVLRLVVPAQGRSTADIRALNHGNSVSSVGMLVSSDQPLVAERVEYFGAGTGSAKFGSTVSAGIGAPSRDLRIPFGSAGGATQGRGGTLQAVGDQAYVTILNPSLSGKPASVTVSLTDSGGRSLGHAVVIRVAPGTRQTVSANQVIGPHSAGPYSIAVDADAPIEAEVAQYFGGSPNVGTSPGVALPALTRATAGAVLSALATRQATGEAVTQRVYLYDPYGAALKVSATFYGGNGRTAQGVYSVQAGGITAIDVNQVTRALPQGPIGARLARLSGPGGFVTVAIGRTNDGRSATEDVGVAVP